MSKIPMESFKDLTQKKMVEELRRFDQAHGTELAVGQSRARKKELIEIYRRALKAEAKQEKKAERKAERAERKAERAERKAERAERKAERKALPDDEPPVESEAVPTVKVLRRRECDVFFFVRPGTGAPDRPLTSKESWLLSRVAKLREEISPVYVDRASGRRSNPSRKAKSELRQTLRRLLKPHGIVCLTDDVAKRMDEATAAGRAVSL